MSKPLVVLDGFALIPDGKGIARALRQIITGLVDRAKFDYRVLVTEPGTSLLDIPPWNIRLVSDQLGSFWEQVTLPRTARELGASAIYTLRECGPLWGPRVLLHLTEVPETRLSGGGLRETVRRRYESAVFPRALKRAAGLLAISGATAETATRRLQPGSKDIEVVHLGVDAVFRSAAPSQDGSFIFHLGSSDPRDNTLALARAYGRLVAELPSLPKLVIAGSLGSLAAQLRESPDYAAGRLELLGRVSDQQLATLFRSALFTVQPSSTEGFGLQPLEAMACGSPVIVLENRAIDEVVGLDAFSVPSLKDLGSAMRTLFEDAELRSDLSKRGQARASTYAWDATVEKVEQALVRVVGRP